MPAITGTSNLPTKVYFRLPGTGLTRGQSQAWRRLTGTYGGGRMRTMASAMMGAPSLVGLRGNVVTVTLLSRRLPGRIVLRRANNFARWMRRQGIPLSSATLMRPHTTWGARRARRALRMRSAMLGGFGEVEDVIEETVEESVSPSTGNGLKTAVGVGALVFLGAGLWFGLTKRSATGMRRFRGAV